MGYCPCPMCDEPLGFTEPHVCDPKTIIERVKHLEERARQAERKLDDVQNAVMIILHTLPSMELVQTTIKTEDLRRLWAAAECQWYEAKTSDDFLVRWLVTHRILCEAYDVFESKEGTLLEKLRHLREAVDESRSVLGYEDSILDLSPEDLVKES